MQGHRVRSRDDVPLIEVTLRDKPHIANCRTSSVARTALRGRCDSCAARVGVEPASGLSAPEATRRLKQYGPNELLTHPPTTAARILVDQLKGPVVWLLAAAAAVAALFGQWTEAIAILLVLAINTLIGFHRASRRAFHGGAAEARFPLLSGPARGKLKTLPAEKVVLGDIVLLESGDIVTADIRLVEAKKLFCDEVHADRRVNSGGEEYGAGPADAVVAERTSMAHKGTAITRGTGTGVVVATGMATELGLITRLVIEAGPDISPLERKLADLTGQLVKATLLITALIAAAGMAAGRDLVLMIEAGIALAVAAIPEGLPIVATMALARGMWRMAQRNVVVERLAAVETLGATTLICADKTGTLTENRMTAERLWLPSADYRIDHAEEEIVDAFGKRPSLTRRCGGRSKSAFSAAPRRSRPDDERGAGDPMELALLRLGRSLASTARSAHRLARAARDRLRYGNQDDGNRA